jgi:hypothetical protein
MSKKDIYSDFKKALVKQPLKKVVKAVEEPQKPPEIQKVHIENLPEAPVINIPDTVTLKDSDGLAQKIADKIVIPNEFTISNPTKQLDIPIGKADIPGQADPERYVPVRLTNGKKFYSALEEAYVSGGKANFPFVDPQGKPKQVQLDASGNLPVNATVTPAADQTVHITPGITTAVSGNITTTTTSGQPGLNFPTVQTVNVQSMPQVNVDLRVDDVTLAVSGSITTLSGSQVDVKNFPTIQKVSVQDMPTITAQLTADGVTTAISGNVTTLSGSKTDIQNFPTIQSVREQSPITTITTLSGSSTNIANFPTYQTVNVQNLPGITTVSGSQVDVKNFPTIQKVSVQDMPVITAQLTADGITQAVSGTITTISGSKTDVQNFPTVQTVSVQNIPAITTASGSKMDISNFPTYQTVNIQNIPNITTASGSIVDVKNFPTVQTVQIQGITTISGQAGVTLAVSGIVTAVSGTQHVVVDNFPTTQSVFASQAGGWNMTTLSGSKVDISNFPTIQTVNVQSMPSITTTTASGQPGLNFPTTQTVNVQNMPQFTTISGQVGITDGYAIANILTSSGIATGQNALLQAPTYYSTSFSTSLTSSPINLTAIDAGNYISVAVQITAIGTNATANFQGSNDNSNWYSIPLNRQQVLTSTPFISTTAADLYAGPLPYRYFRLQITGQSAGTTSGVLLFKTGAASPLTMGGQVSINGTQAVNVSQINSTTIDVNSGNKSAGTQRVVIATDQPNLTTPLNVTTASGFQVDIKNLPTYQSVLANVQYLNGAAIDVNSGNKSAGTQRVILATDQPNLTTPFNVTTASGFQVDVKNFPTYQGTRLYDASGNMLGIATSPVTVSGTVELQEWTPVTYSGQTNGKQLVSATAGKFGGYYIYNPNSSVAYMQVFDASAAANVTLGTTAPKLTIGVPATSAANLEITKGARMQNGIVMACTTTAGGATAPVTGLDITVLYK